MQSRRQFLRAAIGTLAVGTVTVVTLGMGKAGQLAWKRYLAQAQANDQAASSKAPTAPSITPNPTGAPVVLIPRADWGAKDPDVAPGRSGEYGPYDPVSNPNGWRVYDQPLAEVLTTIIVHHSALPLTDGPLEIQRLHTEEKGFADIGYQFLIGPNGELYEGRALNVRGAHTFGANYGSVGICLIGNFEEIQPGENQLLVLRALIADLVAQYGGIDHLAGHKDFNPGITLCPGQNLYPLLPGIAQERGLRY